MSGSKSSTLNFTFWLHVVITFLAWVGPFIIDWRLMVVAYLVVQLQFIFFKKCLMNDGHEIEDDEDATFYSYVFSLIGIEIPRKPVKLFVRNGLYLCLGLFSFIWQYTLGNKAFFILPF